jgi:(p)ppGpp synthase/HD superfamily hydrolase
VTAREFAIKAHGDQKCSDLPYVFHLDDVAATLREFGVFDRSLIDASYLHDVLEDTGVTEQELLEKFPTSVSYVVAVTGVGPTRQERNASAERKIAGRSFSTHLKLADRIANVRRSSLGSESHEQKYREEYPAFRAALYREGDASDMWACLDWLMGVAADGPAVGAGNP